MSDAAPTIADAEAAETAGGPGVVRHARLAADLVTSYALAGARVASNAVVVGVLYRHTTTTWVAAFVLMRSMLAVVTYLTGGLGPAMLREMSRPPTPASEPPPVAASAEAEPTTGALEYATPPSFARVAAVVPTVPASRRLNALVLSLAYAAALGVAALFYADAFPSIHHVARPSGEADWFFNGVFCYALGLVLRGTSDPAGAALQRFGCLWLDNALIAAGEAIFASMVVAAIDPKFGLVFQSIGMAHLGTGFVIFCARWIAAALFRDARNVGGRPDIEGQVISRLAAAALTVSLGSFADFLYAPSNLFLIDHYLGSQALAGYGPALQVDAALLLTIAAIAPVLMPRVAVAVARGDVAAARRMYLLAMAAGLGVLIAGALGAIALRGPALRLWLGEVPDVTRSILPLVLVHTVIGGTAGIGRAVLLGMGRFRAYTLSAIVGGVANVGLALLFVAGFGWGLRGIVLATIIAVVGRCAIWMPWYVLRALGAPTPTAVRSDPVRA